MKTALQIITQNKVTPISCMQYLTHCFDFQIEEVGYGSESKNTVGERKKRIKEVGITIFSSMFGRSYYCFLFCNWALESQLLIFSCFYYFIHHNVSAITSKESCFLLSVTKEYFLHTSCVK
jgi:hypothetical protein